MTRTTVTRSNAKPALEAHESATRDQREYVRVFTVRELPKTPNELLGAHWRVRSGHAKKWLRAVENAFAIVGKPDRPLDHALVAFTLRTSGKAMDDDNLRSRFKAVADALVKAKVIVDDSPAHMTATYVQEKAAPREGSITVRVESVE